ncbi:MAG: T9SS type A sorting domain-containing protein, partial [Bacteroidota bacterium]
ENNSLKIKIPNLKNDNAVFKLIDISGKEVLTDGLRQESSEIILPQIKTGVYILQIRSRELNRSKKIFIRKENK